MLITLYTREFKTTAKVEALPQPGDLFTPDFLSGKNRPAQVFMCRKISGQEVEAEFYADYPAH